MYDLNFNYVSAKNSGGSIYSVYSSLYSLNNIKFYTSESIQDFGGALSLVNSVVNETNQLVFINSKSYLGASCIYL